MNGHWSMMLMLMLMLLTLMPMMVVRLEILPTVGHRLPQE
jgi:hypothetical protein